ncbi:MAG: 5'-3'-deoxyribonucleotidase [Patescibacteria group bacterium]
MTILLDQDDTLADTGRYFERVWRERFPERLQIPREQWHTHAFSKVFPLELQEKVKDLLKTPGFFRGLPPIDGVRTAVRWMLDRGHEVWVCTAQMDGHPLSLMEKRQWLEEHIPELATHLVIADDKTLVRGDILVDDKPEIKGVMTPVWRHVLFDAPYNRRIVDRPRILSWEGEAWRTALGIE